MHWSDLTAGALPGEPSSHRFQLHNSCLLCAWQPTATADVRYAHGIGVAQSSCMLAGGLATVILAQPAELADALAFAAKSPDIRGILVLPGAHAVCNNPSAAAGPRRQRCANES
jgi:hypothetical protein